MTRVLLTGAGGFVGSHCLEHLLENTSWQVVATDSFRHKGKTDRIAQVLEGKPHWHPRVSVVTHDLSVPFSEQMAWRMGHVDYVIAMASESHIAHSIIDPAPFIRNNVNVILSTLEFCREARPRAVVVISTDEVYGPEVDGKPHPEWDTIIPSNPYSASKAAQEAIAISYWRTYGVPVVIVNCMNPIGERQDAERFLPQLIKRIGSGDKVTIHGREGDIGTRHYLHARNVADGILHILRDLPPAVFPAHFASTAWHGAVSDRPSRWNVASPERISNLELAEMVAQILGRKLDYELVDTGGAGHGVRYGTHYGLDPAKLTDAGWKPPLPFAESLARTVRWSLMNPEWLL